MCFNKPAIVQSLRRERHKNWPILPKTLKDFLPKEIPIFLENKESFLLFDETLYSSGEEFA